MVSEGSTGSSRLPLNHPHAHGLRLLRLDPRQQQSGRDARIGTPGGDVHAVQQRTQAAFNQLRSALQSPCCDLLWSHHHLALGQCSKMHVLVQVQTASGLLWLAVFVPLMHPGKITYLSILFKTRQDT